MAFHIPLAWYQVTHRKVRLAVATAGITFAVVLMFMQVGFRNAMNDSSTQFIRSLRADLFLISRQYQYINSFARFSLRHLSAARAVPGVADEVPVYFDKMLWKSIDGDLSEVIIVIGVPPAREVFAVPDTQRQLVRLTEPGTVLFDRLGMDRYGPVLAHLAADTPVRAEINGRHVRTVGTFALGATFVAPGNALTSDLGLLHLQPGRSSDQVDYGLLTLVPGSDTPAVVAALTALLPPEVRVLTRQEMLDHEMATWNAVAPIGYIFNFGALMGFIVGLVFVYQILSADVNEHLPEYATLKAMGYSNAYLYGVVLQQAALLALCGFLPGLLLARWFYVMTNAATSIPMHLTAGRAAEVLLITLLMCLVSGALALNRIRRADPADVF